MHEVAAAAVAAAEADSVATDSVTADTAVVDMMAAVDRIVATVTGTERSL